MHPSCLSIPAPPTSAGKCDVRFLFYLISSTSTTRFNGKTCAKNPARESASREETSNEGMQNGRARARIAARPATRPAMSPCASLTLSRPHAIPTTFSSRRLLTVTGFQRMTLSGSIAVRCWDQHRRQTRTGDNPPGPGRTCCP